IKIHADELITAGVNQIVYHGFPYEYKDRIERGWSPFDATPSFTSHINEHNSFWQFLPTLNAYITRLQYLSRQGKDVVPVVLFKTQLSAECEINDSCGRGRTNVFTKAGFGVDYINADGILKSKN